MVTLECGSDLGPLADSGLLWFILRPSGTPPHPASSVGLRADSSVALCPHCHRTADLFLSCSLLWALLLPVRINYT